MKRTKLVFLVIIIFSGIFYSFPPATSISPQNLEGSNEDYLLIGTTSLGSDLDPQFSWDSASFDINRQIWEGLYAYNLGDPNLRIIPRLAAGCGIWSEDGLEFNVTLREGVTYQNGDPFNASCVVFSFDRLRDLCIYENDQVAELYFPYGLNGTIVGVNDPTTDYGYVIDDVIEINEYKVQFKLNYPYMPFQALLCFSASYIMHPSAPTHWSHPGYSYLEYANISQGLAIGTGPYVVEEHTAYTATFEFFQDYYRGTPAIKRFKYLKYTSSSIISQDLLDDDIDVGRNIDIEYLPNFQAAEHLYVSPLSERSVIQYMGMNNKEIPKIMRQAINYAIDYDDVLENVYGNLSVRMTSIVPPGIEFHKDCNVPTFNLEQARNILITGIPDFTQDFGLDATSSDVDWETVADSSYPVANYKYDYNLGNSNREEFGNILKDNLAQIGICVYMNGVTWGQFLSKLYSNRDSLDLFMGAWMPDYSDPSNIINPMMSNTSQENSAQVNDPYLQNLINMGMTKNDPVIRETTYNEIQDYIATDLMPWAFISVPLDISITSTSVSTQRNPSRYQYIFPWAWYGTYTTFTDPYLDFWCSPGCPPVKEGFPYPNFTKPELDQNNTENDPFSNFKIPGYNSLILAQSMVITSILIIATIFKKKKLKK